MTTLNLGDEPTDRLKQHRVKYGGAAQLRHLLEHVTSSGTIIAGIAFTLRHRPPRNLEAIEESLTAHLAYTEDALAHVRRMRGYRDRPVSAAEMAFDNPEAQAALER